MTLVTVVLGTVFGLGLGLLVVALVGTDSAAPRRGADQSRGQRKFDHTGLRAAGAFGCLYGRR